MRRDVRGRVVLVTGASRGIGKRLAGKLARLGAKLALTARSADDLAKLAGELRAAGADVDTFPADLTSDADRRRLVDAVVARFGALDVLVNCAGVCSFGEFSTSSEAIARKVLEVNFFAPIELTRLCQPHLTASYERGPAGWRPAVVNVASICGRWGIPSMSEHCASKHAFVAMTEAFRGEFERFGVDALLVLPGLVRSDDLNRHLLRNEGKIYLDFEGAQPSDEVADGVLKTLLRNRTEAAVGFVSWWVWMGKRLFPRAVRFVMQRKVWRFARREARPTGPRRRRLMCGIAGIIDLGGKRAAPHGAVAAMARALYHRGPDEDGFLNEPGLELANTRLSIVGLADGRQPIGNEDGTVWTVFNGEFFDYPEKRQALEAKGHQFRTHTDTEIIPHLWEDHRQGLFEHLKGQFAVCVWDKKTNEVVIGRDRSGICPLFYAVRRHADTDWLLFASEAKALFASGLVQPKADWRGLNHVFTFFALPGPVTVFDGVTILQPGHYLHLKLGNTTPTQAEKQTHYWRVSYPDRGQEDYGADEKRVVDGFEEVLLAAVNRRLRADVPVVSYLSGGVDSSLVVAMANKALGRPIPTFTISIQGEGLNEENEALRVARHLGCTPVVVKSGHADLRARYPELIGAAEIPVVDTSCLALLQLARSVHEHNYKVALTGEGADEWLAGYSWFKINKLIGFLDRTPVLPVGGALRTLFLKATGQPNFPFANYKATQAKLGGPNGWLDLYGMMSLNKLRFFTPELREKALTTSPWDEINLHPDLNRWHPFNRQMYVGSRIMLPGHLLSSKGDRVAMHSSVETRYAFLDEDVIGYMSKLHPRWKLRGVMKDKFVERKVAERWLPADVAWRRKMMFRAPMDSWSAVDGAGGWIEQVLSPESLTKAGYFDPAAVAAARAKLPTMRRGIARTSLEMGLTAVTATQVWHHLYLGGGLCDLPMKTPPAAAGGLAVAS